MKVKKTLTVLAVSAFGALSLAGLAACGEEEHVHNYVPTVITPATCVSAGSEKGVCKCGEETEPTVIPISSEAHGYGDWKVEKPEANKEGSAVKICEHEASHKIEVTLPALESEGGGAYTVTETLAPTATTAGENRYEYAHAAGAIAFTEEIAPLGFSSVEAAVNFGATRGNLVRRGSGTTGSDYGSSLTEARSLYDFSYEFGDKYLHYVDDAAIAEFWYGYNGDEIFGVIEDGMGKRLDGKADEDSLIGMPLSISWMGFRAIGVEGFVETLYGWASVNENEDFKEEITETEDGVKIYSFSFGTYDVSLSRFNLLSVSFSFDENFIINEMNMLALGYTTGDYRMNDRGICTVTRPNATHYINSVSVTQVAKQADDEIPVNPFNFDEMIFSSFDLSYGNKDLTESDNTVNVTATSDKAFEIQVKNMLPASADILFDPVSVYLEKDGKLTELDFMDTLSKSGVWTTAMFNSSNGKIIMKTLCVGDNVIVVKTMRVTRKFILHVAPAAPTELIPSVRTYFEAADVYDWENNTVANIFAGQSINFTAKVSDAVAFYTDGTFTASASKGATLTEGENGIWSFTADTAGTYTIYVKSVAASDVTCEIKVTVAEVPDLAAMLTGSYENRRGDETVIFDADTNEVSIKKGDNITVLTYEFAEGVLTTAYKSGADNTYSLKFNANYSLVLVNRGVGNLENKVVLSRPTTNPSELLVGDWTASSDEYGSWTLTFNADGKTGMIKKGNFAHYFAFTLAEDESVSGKYIFTFSEDAANASKNKEGMNEWYTEMNDKNYAAPNGGKSYFVFGDGGADLVITLFINKKNVPITFTQS